MRGLSFEIPNTYGKHLFEFLKCIDIQGFTWKIGDGEAQLVENNTLSDPLFESTGIIEAEKLYKKISNNEAYLIFTDLKAFSKGNKVKEIETYEEFMESNCEFVFLLVDSSYVTIYSKDQDTISKIYEKAISNGYGNIDFVTDKNDERTRIRTF